MDAFLENEEWEEFHTRLNTVISDELSQLVGPRYVVRIERRVYVEHVTDGTTQRRRADVSVLAVDSPLASGAPQSGVTLAMAPVECLLPISEEVRETYVIVRERETRDVVTVLEALSPGNKRLGSDGRREYLAKRDELLRSQAHLIELDLLRGGERLPMETPLPPGDYYVILSRRPRRPRAEVFAWTIRDRLPTIPVPLLGGDADVPLDLQTAFHTVYDRAHYDRSIDYAQPLVPPLSAQDTARMAELLAKRAR
jgi:hypothetical protein